MTSILTNTMNLNENNIIIQPTKQFTKNKHKIFVNERIELLNKIYNILGINNDNKIFYSHIIDSDSSIKNQINNLENDINKYFRTSSWPVFRSKTIVERRELSIIKCLLKDMDVDCKKLSGKLKNEKTNQDIYTTIYTITN